MSGEFVTAWWQYAALMLLGGVIGVAGFIGAVWFAGRDKGRHVREDNESDE